MSCRGLFALYSDILEVHHSVLATKEQCSESFFTSCWSVEVGTATVGRCPLLLGCSYEHQWETSICSDCCWRQRNNTDPSQPLIYVGGVGAVQASC